MAHIPKHALILYCPLIPNQHIPNVDDISLNGCSGQLVLETNKGSTLLELLGLYDTTTTVDIKSRYKERFNDMSLAIISNSTSASQIALDLSCDYDVIQSVDQIKQLKTDVVFVDFSGYKDDAWHFINDLCNLSLPDTIQCIISPAAPSTQKQESQSNWYDSIVPRQSYTMKNGRAIEAIETRLIYSYLHPGSSRRDHITTYTALDIQMNGSNSTILAWHLLAEIGHKLGFVPKYGA